MYASNEQYSLDSEFHSSDKSVYKRRMFVFFLFHRRRDKRALKYSIYKVFFFRFPLFPIAFFVIDTKYPHWLPQQNWFFVNSSHKLDKLHLVGTDSPIYRQAIINFYSPL